MWESTLHQTLYVHLTRESQRIQSSDWPNWHCALWRYFWRSKCHIRWSYKQVIDTSTDRLQCLFKEWFLFWCGSCRLDVHARAGKSIKRARQLLCVFVYPGMWWSRHQLPPLDRPREGRVAVICVGPQHWRGGDRLLSTAGAPGLGGRCSERPARACTPVPGNIHTEQVPNCQSWSFITVHGQFKSSG